jgi:hypothetical protein
MSNTNSNMTEEQERELKNSVFAARQAAEGGLPVVQGLEVQTIWDSVYQQQSFLSLLVAWYIRMVPCTWQSQSISEQ